METKVQNLETNRLKKSIISEHRCFTSKIADMAGCKPRNVQYVINGQRGKRGGPMTRRIEKAIELFIKGEEQLIQDIKNSIHQPN